MALSGTLTLARMHAAVIDGWVDGPKAQRTLKTSSPTLGPNQKGRIPANRSRESWTLERVLAGSRPPITEVQGVHGGNEQRHRGIFNP
jgi:hypothetical protein